MTTMTLTSAQWQELARMFHSEGIREQQLFLGHEGNRTPSNCIGITGTVNDMIVFVARVAQVLADDDDSLAMQHLLWLADHVEKHDDVWWLPCVLREESN